MHDPPINTLNQRVRYRSMTLRRALRNSRISTLSLYVSNTLKLVQKGDTKPKRGKCISRVMLHMGVSCAACHVCRSGIRVNWSNPSPRNKNYKSHQCKFGQTNHQRICRSASHFLFHRRVGVCIPYGYLTSTCHQAFTWVDSQTYTQLGKLKL